MNNCDAGLSPEPKLQETVTGQRRVSIGLPACPASGDRRFPLTPEGAHRLVERGFTVRIEQNAGAPLHYTDNRYLRQGASVVNRAEALGCDIVIHPAPLSPEDVRRMKRGAMLLTLLHGDLRTAENTIPLLNRHITAIALDLIEDEHGNRPYSDILAEIDGRAAVTIGAGLLADPKRSKGILLGGISGVVPCEAMVIGSGIAACAAARCANGLGATVRMFDNDVYSLRRAVRELGTGIIASSLNSHVVENALRSADIVIAAGGGSGFRFDAEAVALMKGGAVVIDLSERSGSAFPSLPCVDVTDAATADFFRERMQKVCLVNPGNAVARSTAMAVSDTLLTTFRRMFACRDVAESLSRMPGLRRAALTFLGRIVNPVVAQVAGMRQVDINIYLRLS